MKPVLTCLASLAIVVLLPHVAAPAEPPVAPPKLLGVFGGMGPEATANLYQEIVRLTPAKRDQDHIPTLVYSLPQVPDRTAAIASGDRRIIPYLVEGVTRLERSGASLIVIPCNTAHYFYDDMQRAVRIPIVHMIRETARAVAERYPKCRRVGLLATSGTIASGLYEKELHARGLTVVCPPEPIERDCVMKAVYAIKSGGAKREAEELLFTAGRDLEQKGAEVIVLGCTEIPLAFNSRRASVPVVSATRVLAEAAIREYSRITSSSERKKPMKRYGMVIGVRPEKLEEYKRLHAAVWPDVLAMIRACNIRNYSIYYKDGRLFSYFEYVGDDFAADMAKMAADPTTQRWWDLCKPCQEPLPTRAEGEWWADMQEVFHCD